MTGPWWWQTTGARHRVENVPFRTWRKSPLCASSCRSLLALHISSVSSKAPRLHQLFTARSSSGVGPRKPWTLLHSALIVHVDFPLAASERRDEDEVLLLFRTFVVFCSKWMKLWVWLLVTSAGVHGWSAFSAASLLLCAKLHRNGQVRTENMNIFALMACL